MKKKPVKKPASAPLRKKKAVKVNGAQSVTGFEYDRGRTIPYTRTINGNVTITYYGRVPMNDGDDGGELETSILVKRTLPGGNVTWNISADGETMRHGEADRRQLQGIAGNKETQRLWWAVQQVKISPSAIDDDIDGRTIREAICDNTGESCHRSCRLLRR